MYTQKRMRKNLTESKINRLLFIMFLGMASLSANAQSRVEYAYDAAGNRVKRDLILNAQQSRSQEDNQIYFTATPSIVYDNLQMKYVGESDFSGLFNYTIQTISGEMVVSGKSTQPTCTADVSQLSSGYYILMITYQDKTQSFKIIKK